MRYCLEILSVTNSDHRHKAVRKAILVHPRESISKYSLKNIHYFLGCFLYLPFLLSLLFAKRGFRMSEGEKLERVDCRDPTFPRVPDFPPTVDTAPRIVWLASCCGKESQKTFSSKHGEKRGKCFKCLKSNMHLQVLLLLVQLASSWGSTVDAVKPIQWPVSFFASYFQNATDNQSGRAYPVQAHLRYLGTSNSHIQIPRL